MRIRCNNAAGMALATNRHFRELAWVQEMARMLAANLFEKDGDASGLLDLAPADARDILQQEIPRIIKTQKASGLWRTKNARAISLSLLKALAHAGLLDTVVPQLRYDPYLPFREADDWYGIAVRCQVLQQPRADEQAVKARVLEEIAAPQCADGSWEHTVVATVHHLEILAEAGLADTPSFTRGIAYLFACLQPDMRRGGSDLVVAHDMITSDDRAAEYRSTAQYRPQWLPHIACHSHLPMIQTYYALRLLNNAGYEDDPRVMQACRNLVNLYERFGGWCDTNIRRGLEAEAKKSKELA